MSETARMLADTAERFLERNAPEPGQAPSEGFIAAMQETGLALALAPEEAGGIAGSWSDAAVIARIWGQAAAPLPIVEIMLAARFAGLAGDDALFATIAQPKPLALKADGTLCGPMMDAAWADGMSAVLAVAKDEAGKTVLVSVPASKAELGKDLAGGPRLKIDPAALSASDVKALGAVDEPVAELGGLLMSAAMLGAMDKILEIVIEHANTRHQFGKPLAKFQAIQHALSDAASEITATRAALDGTLKLADEGRMRPFDGWVVKVQAARAATLVAATAHQVLGAIGFTDEHMLHHYTKRLWTWRDDWGRQAHGEQAIGKASIAAGRDGLWSLIIGDDVEAA
jgi:acyl-CoA dehydrogenase